MIPMWFWAVSSVANAISNIYTAKKSRKLTLELEDRREREKRINDVEAFKRTLETQRIAHVNEVALQNTILENHLTKIQIEAQYARNQIWAKRGDWISVVAPNAKPPFVIFDNNIRSNNTNKADVFDFNPMESLAYSFTRHTRSNSPYDIYITDISQEFKNQASVEAFYNDEFWNIPAIIVFGSFDGNYLRIYAVYGGVSLDQHVFDKEFKPIVLPKKPASVCLCEIPISILASMKNESQNATESYVLREKMQKNLIDMVANFSLQSLLDCHYSIYHSSYEPIIGHGSIIAEAEKLDMLTTDLKTAISTFRNDIIDQHHRIKLLRNEYISYFFKNDWY